MAAACHTGHADEVAALFDRAVAEFGKVDGLVNNAATNPYFGPTLGVTDSAFDKIFEVNVKGYLVRLPRVHRPGRRAGPSSTSPPTPASTPPRSWAPTG